MKKPLLFFLSLFLAGPVVAQTGISNSVTRTVTTGQTYNLTSAYAEAVGIKCEACVFDQAYFLAGKDTVRITPDTHADMAALVFFPAAQETVTFYSGAIKGTVKFDFIKAAATKPTARKTETLRTGDDDCEIQVVPPTVWRAGLPAPSYTPGFAPTKVIAIHHGDSPNVTTYQEGVNAVRSYYTYHTTSNGWSDIGYNYLIGPDGSIFLGREKLSSQTNTSDNIIGAHLCAKNTGAMGICLVGRFTNEFPTAKALESLYKLIKWKAKKDNIDINGSSLHHGNTVPNVLGHRQGPCATSCPGDLLFTKLPQIRTEASNLCNQPLGIAADEMTEIVIVYPNPSQGKSLKANFPWTSLTVYSLDGKRIRAAARKTSDTISTDSLAPGVYLFHFDTPDYGKVVRRIVVN